MTITLSIVCLIVGFIFFLVQGFRLSPKFDWVALGFAAVVLAVLFGTGSLSVHS